MEVRSPWSVVRSSNQVAFGLPATDDCGPLTTDHGLRTTDYLDFISVQNLS